MKRTYLRPAFAVVLLNSHQHLLAVSGKETNIVMSFGDNAGSEDEAGARSSGFWDDDE